MKYIRKDITTIDRGIIVHGVNCLGVMGSGVALAIRNKFPMVWEAYSSMPTGKNMLGVTHFVNVGNNVYVANCYTQVNFGSANKKYADINAVETCLRECYDFAKSMDLPLCSVKIASLRGGLDWDTEVEPIFIKLNREYEDVDVAIYYI